MKAKQFDYAFAVTVADPALAGYLSNDLRRVAAPDTVMVFLASGDEYQGGDEKQGEEGTRVVECRTVIVCATDPEAARTVARYAGEILLVPQS